MCYHGRSLLPLLIYSKWIVDDVVIGAAGKPDIVKSYVNEVCCAVFSLCIHPLILAACAAVLEVTCATRTEVKGST
jgi:hypothetical protein